MPFLRVAGDDKVPAMSYSNIEHWQKFYEFCYYEKLAGGPDPHMACVGAAARLRGMSWDESAWLGALYASVYNVPTALALHSRFPTPDHALDQGEVEEWLRANWAGIAFRRERKAVRSPIKLARCLTSFAEFCDPERLEATVASWKDIASPVARFETAFEDVCSVYGIGRYIGQKFIEYGRRYCDFQTQVHDIRAKDGWSPRVSLALLAPEHAELLIDGGDSPETVRTVEAIATQAREQLSTIYGLDLDYYELQVLLCDYKQSAVGRRQYPGRSQDSELDYDVKIAPHWGTKHTEMYDVRRAIFPSWALGEHSGWDGVRKELRGVLVDHGYTWSDALYDYHQSKNNLSTPAPK